MTVGAEARFDGHVVFVKIRWENIKSDNVPHFFCKNNIIFIEKNEKM